WACELAGLIQNCRAEPPALVALKARVDRLELPYFDGRRAIAAGPVDRPVEVVEAPEDHCPRKDASKGLLGTPALHLIALSPDRRLARSSGNDRRGVRYSGSSGPVGVCECGLTGPNAGGRS